MIRLLNFSSQDAELNLVEQTARRQASHLTDDRWEIFSSGQPEKVKAFLEEIDTLDATCFDVTVCGGIEELEQIRSRFHKAYVILVAGTDTSPLLYMKPSIMAASLLLRPLKPEKVRQAIAEMIEVFDLEKKEDAEVLVLEDEDGRVRIPCHDIFYFEAREKKIYACTATKEYGFYDTFEKLKERLPDGFLRVHRGFLVNIGKIRKADLTENILYLAEDFMVPISRSYRAVVKQMKQEGKIH